MIMKLFSFTAYVVLSADIGDLAAWPQALLPLGAPAEDGRGAESPGDSGGVCPAAVRGGALQGGGPGPAGEQLPCQDPAGTAEGP